MHALLLDVYGTLFRYERERLLPTFAAITQTQGLAVEGKVLFERWQTHESAFRRRRVFRQDGRWVAAEPFRSYQQAWRACFVEAFTEMSLPGDPGGAVEILLRDLRKREIYPEVPDALAALRARVPIALVSNADGAFLFESLTNNGLSFDTVVYSEQERVYKPHPLIFQRALEKVGAEPEQVLYAGDSPLEDIVGPAGIGIPAVWVNRRQEEWPLAEPRPVYEVPDLLGLVDVLSSRTGVVY